MRKTIAIIGEGITEKYYIESIKGISPFTILPKELGIKASSLKSLEKNIISSIDKGFDEVYCLIDMDGKTNGKAKNDYLSLKRKFHNKVFLNKNKGLKSKVFFIETERCIELWFLFYFSKGSTTRKFNTYKELENELKTHIPNYVKSEAYFKSIGNMHKKFEKEKGSIINAFQNSKSSISSKSRDERNYTYSEMFLLIEALGILSSKK